MFKLKYRNSVSTVEVSFDEYIDMVYYVASNHINDADVVSITLFGQEVDLVGLYDIVKEKIEEYKTAQDENLDVEELDWEDEPEDSDCEADFASDDEDDDEDYCNECTLTGEMIDQLNNVLEEINNIGR